MPETNLKVRFQDQDFLLLGDLTEGGPLATPEQYQHGQCSYAHLFEDGQIRRFGKIIGTRADLTVLEEDVELPEPEEDFFDGILGESWS